MRKILLVLLLSLAGLANAAVALKPGHPDRYTVVKGDTLWDIAGTFLQQPWQWPHIWHVNPQIANPHLIYPGDTLSLSYVQGQPRLILSRGGESANNVLPERKLSPDKRITPLPAAEAIPPIPLKNINSFLLTNRIINSESAFTTAPYVIAGDNGRVLSGIGDNVYVRGQFAKPARYYSLLRQGKTYRDPKTGEFLGINADAVGDGTLAGINRDIATLHMGRSYLEVRPGDRLFSSEEPIQPGAFIPRAPERPINGVILDVPRRLTQIGQYDVVTINKGRRDGLQPGDVLAIYKTGEKVRDQVAGGEVQLPDQRAGLLMVFRVYAKLSYGLVLKATRPLAVMDKVRNPD